MNKEKNIVFEKEDLPVLLSNMWKTEEDVLSTLDEISVFTKDQQNVKKLKINSSKTEHRKKLKDSKRKEEHIERGTDEDVIRNGRYTEGSEEISEYSSLEGNDVGNMPFSSGRAQQISHYKLIKQSLSRENYIHTQVQMVAGSYSNDLIEQNWRESVNLNTNVETEAVGNISEEPVGRFDDAEDTEERSSLTSSFASKSDELSSKETTTEELSYTDKSGEEKCGSQSRTSPTSLLVETEPVVPVQPVTETRVKTKPARQRNALLLSLQRKTSENEKSLEATKKDSACENSSVSSNDCENSNIDCKINIPSTSVECNLVYSGVSSVWSGLNSSHAYKSDPIFAPTSEKVLHEFHYKEEEFPPL